jgi:hypothetical protein
MSAPESQTSPKEALSSFLGAAIGNPEASIPLAPVEAVQATYGSPADVALRIEKYLAHDGRENSATLLLYEAMKALRAPAAGDALPTIKGAAITGGYVVVTPAGWGEDKPQKVRDSILRLFPVDPTYTPKPEAAQQGECGDLAA